MARAPNKMAMRRLVQDQEELRSEPVSNVSAAPLESDMFEWHCNIQQGDVVYHLILFMPDNYPYKSPSAEFLPQGFSFCGGATTSGTKGTKVCLNIFSDFAMYHTEWQNQKGFGWSPAYTTQTVLMNLVAFLAETTPDSVKKHNAELSKKFVCKDCGHSYEKPFPPLSAGDDESTTVKGKGKAGKGVAAKNKSSTSKTAAADESTKSMPMIVDYISKARFGLRKPASRDDLYGYGLIVSGPKHRPSLTTPCEFLSGESFFGMHASMGTVHSSMKEELTFFLPMYIHPTHGKEIKDTFEKTIQDVGKMLPSVKKSATMEEMILKTIPNLMAATVVEFSKGTQHTSDNSLTGYFALHRILLWALEAYPNLQSLVDSRLQEFIDDEDKRTKKECPHIGEWLMLLSASQKYRWTDAAEAYLYESFRRNVMWYVKDDERLGYLDTDKDDRLKKTFTATSVSRKILAFQVLFLDIALPADMTRKQLVERYDARFGFPTPEMVTEMKSACDVINNKMTTYDDWFKVLKLKPWSEDELFTKLNEAVKFSILTDGYHWTFFKTGGGWNKVLKKYEDMRNQHKDAKGGAKSKKEPPAAGKGAKGKKDSAGEETDAKSGKGRGGGVRGGRGASRGRGAGRGARGKKEEPMDDDDSEQSEEEMDTAEVASGGRGRGRGRGTPRGGAAKRGASASKSPGPQRKKARK